MPLHGQARAVRIALKEFAVWGEKVQSNQRSKQPANKKEEGNRKQIKDRDALGVFGQQPRSDSVIVIQVMLCWNYRGRSCSGTHGLFPDGFAGLVPCWFLSCFLSF